VSGGEEEDELQRCGQGHKQERRRCPGQTEAVARVCSEVFMMR